MVVMQWGVRKSFSIVNVDRQASIYDTIKKTSFEFLYYCADGEVLLWDGMTV